jgi:hypothetical protein
MNRGVVPRIMESQRMGDDLSTLFERIRGLIEARPRDPNPRLLTEMEHTLTDGYARALELESEVWRIERRIGELAHEVDHPDEAEELRGLAARLRTTRESLESLRDLLTELRHNVEAARAAPQPAP